MRKVRRNWSTKHSAQNMPTKNKAFINYCPIFLISAEVELNRPQLMDSIYESVCAVPDLNEFLDNYTLEQSKLSSVHGQSGLPPSSTAPSISTSSYNNGKSSVQLASAFSPLFRTAAATLTTFFFKLFKSYKVYLPPINMPWWDLLKSFYSGPIHCTKLTVVGASSRWFLELK